jgi:hypothetical protein
MRQTRQTPCANAQNSNVPEAPGKRLTVSVNHREKPDAFAIPQVNRKDFKKL